MKNTLQKTGNYQWKGNKKQRLAMEMWLDPRSITFGNVYRSFKNAGFADSYARNVTNLAPKWLSEYIDRQDMQPEHIKAGIQKLAISAPNSRSPDDTRLKAYETLAKIGGMIDNKGSTTNVIVQPILGGESVKPLQVDTKVIDS